MEYLCSNLTNETNPKTLKEGILSLSNMVKRLDFIVNNVMNVSTLDAQKLNIIEKKYNLPLNDLYLYGDDLKIKQILYSLLTNSLEKTKKGYVEFRVNTIEKIDVARIIFNISDSGPGIGIDKINEILSSTGTLDKEEIELFNKKEVNVKLCQKVIKFMGGHLMIKSSSKGTETTVVIDQKMVNNQPKDFYQEYKNFFNDYKRVLVISQDKELVNNLKRLSNKYNLTIINILYGTYAIDRLKTNTYDYILISDSMKKMNGYEVLQEIKKLNLDIPVMVMLDENNKKLGKHFIEDGFTDYIIINDLENELTRIFEKFD